VLASRLIKGKTYNMLPYVTAFHLWRRQNLRLLRGCCHFIKKEILGINPVYKSCRHTRPILTFTCYNILSRTEIFLSSRMMYLFASLG
jgi:hypothetical protein